VERDDRLATSALLISEILQEHGYHTGLITTNPNIGSFFGFDQGFDEFIELYARSEAGYVRTTELTTGADTVAARAKQWIQSAPKPFFLVVLAIDPHAPYLPPDSFDRYGEGFPGTTVGSKSWINRTDLSPQAKKRVRSLYHGEIAFSDHALGLLMEQLRELAIADQTITLLTSDHGEEFWEHGTRGHGQTLFDEVLRVPLIVNYPPRVPPGQRVDRPVSLMDVIPTLLDLAQLPIPPELSGRSLFEADEPEEVTLLSTLHLGGVNQVASREGRWKLIWDQDSDQRVLFDTAANPGEMDDLSAEQPERLRAMSKRMIAQLRESRERSRALHGDKATEKITPDRLPRVERELLETLGYLESEE
jgi:arylsulfatase A-like enzyme